MAHPISLIDLYPIDDLSAVAGTNAGQVVDDLGLETLGVELLQVAGVHVHMARAAPAPQSIFTRGEFNSNASRLATLPPGQSADGLDVVAFPFAKNLSRV